MKVLFRYVLIRPLENDVKKGDFYMPETAIEKPQKGEVVEVGDECTKVKKGDKVLFKKWGGNEVPGESEQLLMIEEVDLMAVL